MKSIHKYRILLSGILLTLMVGLAPQLSAASNNLALNPGFEASSLSGVADWKLEHWNTENAVVGKLDAGVYAEGKQSLRIEVPEPDDARVEQTIPVQPNHWYRFSAWVKTEGVDEERVGANLSVMGAMEHSPDVRGTHDWRKIEVWGKTAADQTEIRLAVRLGFYGSTNTGKAWFDDIQVLEVNAPSPDAPQMVLSAPSAAADARSQDFLLGAMAVLSISVVFALLAGSAMRQYRKWSILDVRSCQLVLFGLLVLAIKLVLAGYISGYGPDIKTFSAWAIDLYRHGLSGFYRPDYFADYPPGYMYLLWPVGAVIQNLHLTFNTPAFLVVLKLPAILADVLTAWWLFRWGFEQQDRNAAFIAAFIWLINPLTIITSSAWGQVDSIFTLVMVLSLINIERKRFPRAAVWYALAILLKPQALLLAPLSLIALLQMPNMRLRLYSVASFVLAFVLLILPFSWAQSSPLWIWDLYRGTLGSYPYLSLNAFNLYTLLQANWLPLETTFLGVGVGIWAWLLVICCLLPILYWTWRSRVPGRYLWAAAAIIAVFFVFAPKMHERYLFPATLMALVAWLWLKDRRLFLISTGFSLTSLINVWLVLDAMMRSNTPHVEDAQWLLPVVSLSNVGLVLYMLYVGWQVLSRRQGLVGVRIP